ncbi:MAG: hypothetical protein R2991_10380 [Thermoanaerobaculia bacterium]
MEVSLTTAVPPVDVWATWRAVSEEFTTTVISTTDPVVSSAVVGAT